MSSQERPPFEFVTNPYDRRKAEERAAFYAALPFGLPEELLKELLVEVCDADDRCWSRCSESGCESYRHIVDRFLRTLDKEGWKVVRK